MINNSESKIPIFSEIYEKIVPNKPLILNIDTNTFITLNSEIPELVFEENKSNNESVNNSPKASKKLSSQVPQLQSQIEKERVSKTYENYQRIVLQQKQINDASSSDPVFFVCESVYKEILDILNTGLQKSIILLNFFDLMTKMPIRQMISNFVLFSDSQ